MYKFKNSFYKFDYILNKYLMRKLFVGGNWKSNNTMK